MSDLRLLLKGLQFAAHKHRFQRRKGREGHPYINHPIEIAVVLAEAGSLTDLTTLLAAILHDTIEDTETTPSELEAAFGREVRELVEEVTDDKRLPKAQRKRLQVDHAPNLSESAKQLKIADKICNARDVTGNPPMDWPHERRRQYFDWAEQVVAGCRGCNAGLERMFDEVLAQGRLGLKTAP